MNKTIKDLLIDGQKKISWSPTPFLDTELLLSFLLKKNRAYLSANPDFQVSEKIAENYYASIARRARKEPIVYIIGEKEFYGFTFFVDKNVLIPRPETELLVEESIKLINKGNIKKIVDIGTGSGCVILSIAKKICDDNPEFAKEISWYTTEISEKAVSVAKKNYKRIFPNHEVRINIIKGSLFGSIRETFDLILSNPPYIGEAEFTKLDENVKKYEPSIALLGGPEGYEFTIKLLKEAKQKISKNGHIILEINSRHAEKIKITIEKLYKKCKLEIKKDYSESDRIVIINT